MPPSFRRLVRKCPPTCIHTVAWAALLYPNSMADEGTRPKRRGVYKCTAFESFFCSKLKKAQGEAVRFWYLGAQNGEVANIDPFNLILSASCVPKFPYRSSTFRNVTQDLHLETCTHTLAILSLGIKFTTMKSSVPIAFLAALGTMLTVSAIPSYPLPGEVIPFVILSASRKVHIGGTHRALGTWKAAPQQLVYTDHS